LIDIPSCGKSWAGLGCLALALLLTSCVSRPRAAVATAVPRFIELQNESSIATFHFPRGLYSLDSEDDQGRYYRAPRRIVKHSFAGFAPYEGGIFIRKDDRRQARGYIVWAGGRTKFGDLSRAHYIFRD